MLLLVSLGWYELERERLSVGFRSSITARRTRKVVISFKLSMFFIIFFRCKAYCVKFSMMKSKGGSCRNVLKLFNFAVVVFTYWGCQRHITSRGRRLVNEYDPWRHRTLPTKRDSLSLDTPNAFSVFATTIAIFHENVFFFQLRFSLCSDDDRVTIERRTLSLMRWCHTI